MSNNTWKSYVDWWPTYLVLGISLAYLVDQTGIIPQLTKKFFTDKGKEREMDN